MKRKPAGGCPDVVPHSEVALRVFELIHVAATQKLSSRWDGQDIGVQERLGAAGTSGAFRFCSSLTVFLVFKKEK